MSGDDYAMPGYCWDRKPGCDARCLDEPGHGKDHSNWHTDERWPNGRAVKPTAQATD